MVDPDEIPVVTEQTDETDLFDEDLLARTAENHSLEGAELAEIATRHQAGVASLPGVENLAYEWRKQYEDPLVQRTERAYYMRVPDWVWNEFADALSLDDESLAALVELHREHLRSETAVDGGPPDGEAYVVLDRTVD